MNGVLFRRSARSLWKTWVVFAAVLSLYVSMITAMFDPKLNATLDEILTAMPQLMNMVGMQAGSSSLGGFLINYQMCIRDRVTAELLLHSDQGFQYASQSYFALTTQYGITPSMSRRANPYDNAMAENFFSILKSECIPLFKPETIREAQTLIDGFITFYTHERIQPVSYTHLDRGVICSKRSGRYFQLLQ